MAEKEQAPVTEAMEAAKQTEATEVIEATEATPVKKRKRRVKYAAPLGFLVLFFACIGVIATIVSGMQAVLRWTDDTPLREELYAFLDPVMQFCPSDFTDAADPTQDTLLLSAVYRLNEAERIRQLQEKDNEYQYPLDDSQLRMKIPQATVEASFAALFGDAKLIHRTVGDVEYKEDEGVYYVPVRMDTSGYTPVLGSVKRSGDTYTVQVAYVLNDDVQYDDRGQQIPPTVAMGKYSQLYTVKRGEDDRLVLVSVAAMQVAK